MGFRSGLIVGFAIGYVLGAKAGRERYEELRKAWEEFTGNPAVRDAVNKGKEMVESGVRDGLHAVQGGVEKATEAVRDRLGEEEEEPGAAPT